MESIPQFKANPLDRIRSGKLSNRELPLCLRGRNVKKEKPRASNGAFPYAGYCVRSP